MKCSVMFHGMLLSMTKHSYQKMSRYLFLQSLSKTSGSHNHLTQVVMSTKVVKSSVTTAKNNPFQAYSNPDNQTTSSNIITARCQTWLLRNN